MTGTAGDSAYARLAAAVDEAIPAPLATAWHQYLGRQPVAVARQAIFTAAGRVMGYDLSFRSPQVREPSDWSTDDHERATSQVLRFVVETDHLAELAAHQLVFIRATRAHLLGDLPLPERSDRLVLVLPRGLEVDTRTLIEIGRLRRRGFRTALPSFSDRPHQRRLLPLADYVKIDVRDLDVEGHPVVRVARSCGATLIGEYVEHEAELDAARELGLTLFQGNLLERAGLVVPSTSPRARH